MSWFGYREQSRMENSDEEGGKVIDRYKALWVIMAGSSVGWMVELFMDG